jgi:alginate O-acetyltransferase complex protein AlgJ
MSVKIRQTIIAALFILFLVLPLLAGLLERIGPSPLNEKRLQASLPTLKGTGKDLAAFPRQFDAYYDDHFGFRASLIRGFNYVKVFWFHSSPTDTVLVGKNGWLFYWDEYSRNSFLRRKPFSPKTELLWKGYLRMMKDCLDSRGAKLFMIVAPNKGTIYPEYMPSNIHRGPGPSNLDRLLIIAKEAGLPIIDVRQELEQAKNKKKLFFQSDSHWNDAGAYIAYRKLMEAMIPYLPKINPVVENDLSVQQKPHTSWKDLAVMLGLPQYFPEEEERYDFHIPRKYDSPFFKNLHSLSNDITLNTGRKDLPKALFFRDSFGIALIPFLAQHFNTFIITEKQDVFVELLERGPPPIVIIEVLERFLEHEDLLLTIILTLLKKEHGIDWLPAADLPAKVGNTIQEAGSFWGTARKASRGTTPAGTLMYGPYTELKSGHYRAGFRLKAGAGPKGVPIVKIDVTAEAGEKVLVEKILRPEDFNKPGQWQTFTLSFEVRENQMNRVEYRAEYLGGADLILEGVRLIPREKIALFDRLFPMGENQQGSPNRIGIQGLDSASPECQTE